MSPDTHMRQPDMTKEMVYDPVASNSDPATVVEHILSGAPWSSNYYCHYSDIWIGVDCVQYIR